MSTSIRHHRGLALLGGLMMALTLSTMTVMASTPLAGAEPVPCSANITGYEGTALLTFSSTDVRPGETVNIIGSGFPPNVTVPLTVGGVSIGAATTDAKGNFVLPYTIPNDAVTGTLAVSSTCGAFVLTSNLRVQIASNVVTNPPTTTTTGTLVPTGSSLTFPLTTFAIVLIVGGGLLVLAMRKSSRGSSTVNA